MDFPQTRKFIQILNRHEGRDAAYYDFEPPLIFHSGKSVHIWDPDGNQYLDLCAGFGVMALGHAHPSHQAVFRQQLEDCPPVVHGMGDVYSSDAKAELIQTLVDVLPPSLNTVVFALSGGQAVEIAIKTAQLRKPGVILSFSGSYHGLDLGILPLTSREDFKKPFQHLHQPAFAIEKEFLGKEDLLEEAFAEIRNAGLELSALIVEPIQGRAGVKPATIEWLKKLRKFADEKDSLLIFDEVFTGLGRSGRWTFAEDVPCDLLCLGKALGGGLPLSACVGTKESMSAWPVNRGEAIHTGTFFGHPLACRLATATIKTIVTHNLVGESAEKGEIFQKILRDRIGDHPLVSEIRGEGLMIGLALSYPGAGVEIMNRLRSLGVIALVSGKEGEVLSLTPPLIISTSDMKLASDRISEALAEMSGGRP